MKLISSAEINKLLRRYLSPLLRDHGFQKIDARKAWRWCTDSISVFEVHAVGAYFSTVTGWPPGSLTAWTGMYYDFIPTDPPGQVVTTDARGRLLPREWGCHIRGAIRPTLDQFRFQAMLTIPPERNRNDIWWVERDGSNIADVIENLASCFVEQALPWFERFRNLQTAFAEIEQEHPCHFKHKRAFHFAQHLGDAEKVRRYGELFEADQVRMNELFTQMQRPQRKKN